MTFKRFLTFLTLTFFLSGCVGPKVPVYKSKPQKFSWGQAYVWMSDAYSTKRDMKTGKGYLLVNMTFKESYLNKNCKITLNHVSMVNSDSGEIILDQSLPPAKFSSLTREIREYQNGQFHLGALIFDFERDKFPYDVNLNMTLNCPTEKTEHDFFKQIKFKMTQPFIWHQ